MPKQFTTHSLTGMDDGSFFFTAAMISTCEPVFDDLDSNYDVEDRLKAAGVIDDTCVADSESCQLWVTFDSREAGVAFIQRLNTYLSLRAQKFAAAKAF